MDSINLVNPIIASDSLILVTGVNGLVASHIVDQLLAANYRVRGTVRDLKRSSWVTDLFERRHGPGRLELIQVSDLAAPGIWPPAVKGVSGIISVAASVELAPTRPAEETAKEEVAAFRALLVAAGASNTVKSVVYTSSA